MDNLPFADDLPYTAIIFAAGYSSRMERFKPLLVIGGRTITDRLIELYRDNQVEVILVVGWQGDQVSASIARGAGITREDVRIVENPDFAKGMFSSIQAGLRAVQAAGCQGVLIHPVDIPLVRSYTLRRLLEVPELLEAAEKSPGRIVYPVCGGKRGHPTLLPTSLIPTILEWRNEGGLKAVLEARTDLSLEIPVPDDFIHLDMDTPDDYRRLLERYDAREIPSADECAVINDIYQVNPDRRRHCQKVAALALTLGQALAGTGQKIDLDLVRAGAVLHDLAKGRKDHAGEGGRILGEMGFARTGAVVAAHSDLPEGVANSSREAKIVFLADKYVAGETPVSVEQRYSLALERFGSDSLVRGEILQRREVALQVQHEFEALLGCSPEQVVRRKPG